jgi:hypothetical protein
MSTAPKATTTPITTEPTTSERIAALQSRITSLQEAAMAAALRVRDYAYAVKVGIYDANDATAREADASATTLRRSLDSARTELRNLEQARQQEQAAVREQALQAEQERRRQWVHAHRPELGTALAAAQQEEQEVLRNPFSRDSAAGQQALQLARQHIQAAQRAIDTAIKDAPAQEVPA